MNPAVTDRYPTRHGGRAELLERADPCPPAPLDGADVATSSLTDEQCEAFARDGFLQVPDVFDPAELAGFDAALDRLVSESSLDDPKVIAEPGAGPAADAIRSVFGFHATAGPLADAANDPRLTGVARRLLGGPVTIHQSRVNRKPGFRGRSFDWHSDFETWHAEDGMPEPRCLSASVALTDNVAYNGPLLVMPGSHRWFASCPEPTPPAHHEQSLQRQQVGVPDEDQLRELYDRCGIHTCTGAAGSVTFFDCNLMHGSANNLSPLPRRNLFLVYNRVDNALVAPFGADRPRPEFLAARDAAPI